MKKYLVVMLAFAICLSVLSGCSKPKPTVDTAKMDMMAKKLLTAITMDKAKNAEFYKENFAQSYKDRVSEKEWEIMAERYRTHLGLMLELDRYATNIQETEYTVETSCAYSVKWEKEAGKLELSLTKEDGGDWKIVSFSITSPKIAELSKTVEDTNLDAYKKEAANIANQKKADVNPAAPSIPSGEEK